MCVPDTHTHFQFSYVGIFGKHILPAKNRTVSMLSIHKTVRTYTMVLAHTTADGTERESERLAFCTLHHHLPPKLPCPPPSPTPMSVSGRSPRFTVCRSSFLFLVPRCHEHLAVPGVFQQADRVQFYTYLLLGRYLQKPFYRVPFAFCPTKKQTKKQENQISVNSGCRCVREFRTVSLCCAVGNRRDVNSSLFYCPQLTQQP